MTNKTFAETELRSLVGLLDEEDPRSLDLVRNQIMEIGEPVIPFLEELRAASPGELAQRADVLTREVRFGSLQRDFRDLARQTDVDLERGAFLVAKFGYPGFDIGLYHNWLDQVAERVRGELPEGADTVTALQRVSSVLFGTLGFAGNEARYYDPDNSFINRVIDTRRGIPVTLSILFLLVARRLGLPAYGVGAPGHFLVGFKSGPYPCFLDAFHKGKLLDISEVRRLLARSGYQFKPEFVSPCSNREIVLRLLRNLVAIFDKMGSTERAERLGSLAEIVLRRGV